VKDYKIRGRINMAVKRKVNLDFIGLDGIAFRLLDAFSKQAKREGWTLEEIKEVMDDAKSGGYDHLLQVIIAHTESE
jgi:hypothetical protein